MAPGTAVKAGGGTGGGGGGKGAGSGGGGSGGGPGGDGSGADGGDQGAGAGSPDGDKYKPCGTKGCPIDVGTGRMYTLPVEDLSLPGPLPLSLERRYSSFASRRDVGLGFGWVHSYAWEVVITPTKTRVWTNTGTWEDFPLLESGREIQGKWGWILRRDDAGFTLDTNEGVWRTLHESADGRRFRLSEEYDRNGNRIVFRYEDGALAEIVDSAGRVVRVLSTPSRRIASISMRRSDTGDWIYFARYEYDDEGNLITVRDANGFTNRYAYDAGGRHLMVENGYKTGLVFYFRYDRNGRCCETYGAYPGASDPSLAPDLPTHLADGVTRIKGVQHVLVNYHADGLREVFDTKRLETYMINEHGLIDLLDIDGKVSSATFREDGWVMSQTDELGHTVTYERDARGNLLSITDKLGRRRVIERDERGLVIRTIEHGERVTEYQRDARGNIVLIRDPSGSVTSYRWDERGVMTEVAAPSGRTYSLTCDEHGNCTAIRWPNGGVFRYTYDDFGRRTSVTNPLGATTRYWYSERGDIIAEQDAAGGVHRTSYDGDGYVTEKTSPSGQVTRYVWGGLHRLARMTDALGRETRFFHDWQGNLVGVSNAAGESHRIDLDGNANLSRQRDFGGLTSHYRYDPLGRVVRAEQPDARVVTIDYDPGGTVVAETFDEQVAVTFEVDEVHRLLARAVVDDSEVRFTRDAAGRVVKETQVIHGAEIVVETDYDADGRVLGKRSSLGHQIAMTRDQLGSRLTTVFEDGTTLEHQHDLMGQERIRTLPRGGVIRSSYDAMGRLAARVFAQGEQPTLELGYVYGRDGEVERTTNSRLGEASYGYDAAGRLATVERAGAPQVDYTFDSRDNLLNGGARIAAGSVLVAKDQTRYEYDGAGRLVARHVSNEGTWRYEWDLRGQLTRVESPHGTRVAHSYDAFGRRIRKRTESLTEGGWRWTADTLFVWDRDVIIHEIEKKAATQGDPVVSVTTYAWDDARSEPVAQRKTDGSWEFYANGPTGGPEALADAKGDVTGVVERDVWGAPIGRPVTPLTLPGQYYDEETRLAYNRSRYYDPRDARYISPDPVGILGGLNAYGYVVDPLLEIDWLGLAVVKDGVLYIKDKFPPGSYESRQLRRFGKAWNEEIQKQPDQTMTTRTECDAEKRDSKNWKAQMRRDNPARFDGKVVAHVPDASAGGPSGPATGTPRAMALDESVNASVGAQVGNLHTHHGPQTYSEVRIVRELPE